jgi:uncharacterized protein involved in exopolysaccharide biosynthesis
MEEQILELYGKLLELDKEKAESPMMDLRKRRAPILSQFIATIRKNEESDDNPLLQEIASLKAKIVKLTEGHETDMKHNVFLAETVSGLLKKQEKTQEALDDKTNQLADIGKELESVNDTCEGLLQEMQELKISRDTVENSAGPSKL